MLYKIVWTETILAAGYINASSEEEAQALVEKESIGISRNVCDLLTTASSIEIRSIKEA